MSKDYYYDPITKDLSLTSSKDLRLTDGIEEFTIQKIEKVLAFVLGEWYLNITEGIPYIAQNNNDRDDNTKNIFVKNPDLTFINNVLILAISNISTIDRIISFESELNTTNRELTVVYESKLVDESLLQSESTIGVF